MNRRYECEIVSILALNLDFIISSGNGLFFNQLKKYIKFI